MSARALVWCCMMRVMTMMTASCMRRVGSSSSSSLVRGLVVAGLIVRVCIVVRVKAATSILAARTITRRVGRRRLFIRCRRRRRRRLILLLFFHLHASILKPNFYLSFGELQHGSQLDSTRSTQIAQIVKLLLEFDELCARVCRACSFRTRR